MSPENPQRHVFVYGTLRKGQVNDINALQPAPHFVGHAKVRGSLHHLGRYPGLLLQADGPTVFGEVYAISPPLERKLDEIEFLYPQETDEYFKREVAVQVAGQTLQCLVYEINPTYAVGKPVIGGGDWCAVS